MARKKGLFRRLRNTEEVRAAVKKFVDDYNSEWQVEKNRFLSLLQAAMDGSSGAGKGGVRKTCVQETGYGTP